MAFQLSRIRDDLGATFPMAYGRIDSATLSLADNTTRPTINWYADAAAAAAGKTPIATESLDLPTTEIVSTNSPFVASLAALVSQGKVTSPRDALKASLYVILKQHAAYSAALDV